MTLSWRDLRTRWLQRLSTAGVADDPAQELRWIIDGATGRTPAEQAGDLDASPTLRAISQIEAMVARRSAGEPLQYVIGRWSFRTLDLLVDPRVLIPRPETEVVAGLAIDAARAHGSGCRAVDLGTGSGAIALSLAAERWPDIEVWATDSSPEALAVARANLAGLGRRAAVVRLEEGDWFDALPGELLGTLDVLVSNPPYVPVGASLPPAVADWEPSTALLAGRDGLADIRRIIAGAPSWLRPGGILVLEIGDEHGPAARSLAAAAGLRDATIERDLAGRDRALVATRQP